MLRSVRRTALAFTLIEAVAVLVVLALLAAISIPTFGMVMDRSRDSGAQTELVSFARSVQAQVAFRQAQNFQVADFQKVSTSLSAASVGVLAAEIQDAVLYDGSGATSATMSRVSYALSTNSSVAGAALVSPSGKCLGVKFGSTPISTVEMPQSLELCHGISALQGPTNGDILDTGTPVTPPPYVNPTPSPSPTPTPTVTTPAPTTVPSAPRNVSAFPGQGSISVKWTTPESSGGSPITRYLITLTPSTGAPVVTEVSSLTRSRTVTGLQGGLLYAVRVAAVSATGMGAPGTAPAVTPTGDQVEAPVAPVDVRTALDVATWKATTSWGPAPTGQSPLGYRIYKNGTFLAQTSGLSYTDPGAFAYGQSAIYSVSAYALGGESAHTSAESPVSRAALPNDATRVVSVVDQGTWRVTTSWDAPESSNAVTGYRIYKNGAFLDQTTSTSYEHMTALAPGESATYSVSTYNTSGEAPQVYAPSVSRLSVPDGPMNVGAGLSETSWQATITWQAPASGSIVSGYRVYRDGALVGQTAELLLTDKLPFAAGETATYSVVSYNVSGASAPVNAPLVGRVNLPGTPTDVSVSTAGSASGWEPTVRWSAPTSGGSVAGYRIYKNGSLVAQTDGLSYLGVELLPGESATYSVSTYNASGESGASMGNQVSRMDLPGSPASASATLDQTSWKSTLTWSAPTSGGSVAGYLIFRDGTQIADQASQSFTDTTALTPGQSATYSVLAYNASGRSAQTSAAPVTRSALPGAPTSVAAVLSDSWQATLTWSAPSGSAPVSGYRIYRDGVLLAQQATTSFTDPTSLQPSQSVTYSVSAYNISGESAQVSAPAVSRAALPGAPLDVATNLDTTSWVPTTTWNAPVGGPAPTGYRIYKNGVFVHQTTSRSHTGTALAPGQSVTYSISAYTTTGGESSQVSAPTVSRAALAAAPASLAVDVSADWVPTLSWPAAAGSVAPSGYRIYKNGVFLVQTVNTTYTAAVLAVGESATYSVSSYTSGGESSMTQAPSVSRFAAPAAPTNVTTSLSSSTWQATTTWTLAATTASAPVEGYHIFRDGATTPTATVGALATSWTDPTALASGASATYSVRSYNSSTTSVGVSGNSVTRLEAPSSPQNLSGYSMVQTIVLNWETPSSAGSSPITGYTVTATPVNGTGTVLTQSVGATAREASFGGLDPSVNYTLSVHAVNSVGSSPVSTLGYALSGDAPQPPATPTNLKVISVESNLVVSWTASTSVQTTYYQVFRNGTFVAKIPSSQTSYTDTIPSSTARTTPFAYSVRAAAPYSLSEPTLEVSRYAVTAANLENGWGLQTHPITTYSVPSYWKDAAAGTPGVVYLSGFAKAPANVTQLQTIFTLPVGYRPAFEQIHAVKAGTSTVALHVLPDGRVSTAWESPRNPANDWVSLEGISFYTGTNSSSAFGSSFTSWSTNWPPAVHYFKDSTGVVHVSGLAKRVNTTSGTVTQLPLGFRPTHRLIDEQLQSSSAPTWNARMDMTANGELAVTGPTVPVGMWVSYQGMEYNTGTNTPLPLRSGWNRYDQTFGGPGYFQGSNGVVHLSGLISTTVARADNDVIGTLPAGMAPSHQRMFTARGDITTHATTGAVTYNSYRIKVEPNGDIVLGSSMPMNPGTNGAQTWLSLDNISFLPH